MLSIVPTSPKYSKQICEFFRKVDGDERLSNIDFGLDAAHRVAYYYGDNCHCILVLEKQVIGYGWIRGWEEDWLDKCLGLIIHPDYRGQGYGEILCRFLVTIGGSRGLSRIRLHVDEDNRVAFNLYEKIGFQFDGSRRENGELIGYLYYS